MARGSTCETVSAGGGSRTPSPPTVSSSSIGTAGRGSSWPVSNHPTEGPAIALFSEACAARAPLAITPEGPALTFSTDGNIVAEIGVADIDPATPEAGPYIMLARANGHALLHLRVDSDGHLVTERL